MYRDQNFVGEGNPKLKNFETILKVVCMTNISLRDILKDAKENSYGIPCIAGSNLEMIVGIIKAAEEKNSPLIVCYNKQLSPGIPSDLLISLIVHSAKIAEVPICTILDHGSEFDLIMKSIHLGMSSVMYDGSGLPFEENVKKTIEIVKIAHSLGVSVEAELGGVGGSALEATASSSIKSVLTVPEEAIEFVKKTGIDALAIAFGNVHGKYVGEPKLDLGVVRKISSMVDIPLVMHGASGLPFNKYKSIIDSGISKINYFSAMCRGSYSNLKYFMESSNEEAFCINEIPIAIDFWKTETMKLLDIFKCSGKAKNFNNQAKLELSSNSYNSVDFVKEISDIIIDKIKKYSRDK